MIKWQDVCPSGANGFLGEMLVASIDVDKDSRVIIGRVAVMGSTKMTPGQYVGDPAGAIEIMMSKCDKLLRSDLEKHGLVHLVNVVQPKIVIKADSAKLNGSIKRLSGIAGAAMTSPNSAIASHEIKIGKAIEELTAIYPHSPRIT